MAGNRSTGAVDRATDSTAFERAARAGHVVSGVVHLLIAYLIVRIAVGSSGNADQSGALSEVASKPGGAVALWVAAAAFLAMALWRLAEMVVGQHPGESSGGTDSADGESGDESDWFDRGKALGLAVVYIGFAITAVQFARGSGKSSGEQNAGLSARLMESGLGKAVLVVVGLVIVAVGVYHVYKGASKNFMDDLKTNDSKVIEPLGIVGYIAKGIVLAGAGILVIVAVWTADPSKATGIDGAVKTLGDAPFGKILLFLAAIGIAVYGLYCFVMARFAKM
ncbi:DUF1206 domain-containing protein [Aldersonia sp. NBC_00410]|uniref:DUF1206 domain-containing protein n=1 Tax=Aldersonia sp. NBC_00410 TaxID=2975954 RepID=UPI002252D475|nr:DUF1206 domain-containing protein [Aldersonia sp. NBC_00410]MCX5045355.1 DUF1206 domain-containing protein [Aldersonia sp. NBC_00410]